MENEQAVVETPATPAAPASLEEYQAAKAAKGTPPPTEKESAAEPKGEIAGAPAAPDQATEGTGDRPRRDRSKEGRIAELIAENKRIEEERETWRKKAEAAEAARVTPPEPKPAEKPESKPAEAKPGDSKPKRREFIEAYAKEHPDATYDECAEAYDDARDEWATKQIEKSNSERDLQRQQQTELQRKLEKRVDDGRKKYKDFDQVTAYDAKTREGLELNTPMQIFFLENDDGHDVAYHLGKNPEEAKRIYNLYPADDKPLDPIKTAKVLAQLELISHKLKQPSEPVTPPVSKAPPPRIQVVGGGERSDATESEPLSEAQSLADFQRRKYRKTG